MALNSNKQTDIFGLGALIPPSADTKKPEPEVKEEAKIKKETHSAVAPVKEKQSTTKPTKKKTTEYFNARVKFFDEDDKDFLKYYGGNLNKTQEEFLSFIVQNAIKDKKAFNPKDEEHDNFRKNTLIYYTSVRIPETLKNDLMKLASSHRLSQEQFLGYLVRKERYNTPGWH